ncbi:Prothoracicotropic hormone [Anthophora quadrimaculata]
MKILIVCMLLHHQLQLAEPSTRHHQWQEDLQEEQEEHRLFEPRTTEILEQRSPWTSNLDNRLPLAVLESSPEQRKRIAASENLAPAWIRISARSTCSCESQYEIRDLGDSHYPRYLTVSHCKPKTCQSKFHSCRLLHYTVHVLRPREVTTLSKDWYMNDSTLPETPLPESLRSKWQLRPISIAVACVSTSDNQNGRN